MGRQGSRWWAERKPWMLRRECACALARQFTGCSSSFGVRCLVAHRPLPLVAALLQVGQALSLASSGMHPSSSGSSSTQWTAHGGAASAVALAAAGGSNPALSAHPAMGGLSAELQRQHHHHHAQQAAAAAAAAGGRGGLAGVHGGQSVGSYQSLGGAVYAGPGPGGRNTRVHVCSKDDSLRTVSRGRRPALPACGFGRGDAGVTTRAALCRSATGAARTVTHGAAATRCVHGPHPCCAVVVVVLVACKGGGEAGHPRRAAAHRCAARDAARRGHHLAVGRGRLPLPLTRRGDGPALRQQAAPLAVRSRVAAAAATTRPRRSAAAAAAAARACPVGANVRAGEGRREGVGGWLLYSHRPVPPHQQPGVGVGPGPRRGGSRRGRAQDSQHCLAGWLHRPPLDAGAPLGSGGRCSAASRRCAAGARWRGAGAHWGARGELATARLAKAQT